MVEWTGLENRRRGNPSVSSNLTASASWHTKNALAGTHFSPAYQVRTRGGNGRRKGLKIPRTQVRAGSIPAGCTSAIINLIRKNGSGNSPISFRQLHPIAYNLRHDSGHRNLELPAYIQIRTAGSQASTIVTNIGNTQAHIFLDAGLYPHINMC